MIVNVVGNLLANEHKAESLAHGVNCLGIMGAGVARALRNAKPALFAAYRAHCANPGLRPGEVFVWGAYPTIFNVATQQGIGAGVQATLPAVRDGLIQTRRLLKAIGLRSMAMPRIGCGLGGLSWGDVKPIVEDVFKNWPGALYIHHVSSCERWASE